jgi:hypothetical protein
MEAEHGPEGSGNVVVLIQSSDPDAIYFGLLYAQRATLNEWMDNVKVLFWGPAEKTLCGLPPDSEQITLLKQIQAMDGKVSAVWACKACSDKYGITQKMLDLGIEVFHTGETMSYLMKLGYRIWNW